MPVTAKQFADRMRNAGRTVGSAQQPAVKAAADAAAAEMRAAAAAGRTKGITVKEKAFSHSDTGAAMNVKYGPNPGWVQIMNGPTQSHFVAARGRGKGSLKNQNLELGLGSKRRSRRGGKMLLAALAGGTVGSGNKQAIRTPYGPKAYAFVHGVHKKGWVERGIRAGRQVAGKAFEAEERKILGRALVGH